MGEIGISLTGQQSNLRYAESDASLPGDEIWPAMATQTPRAA